MIVALCKVIIVSPLLGTTFGLLSVWTISFAKRRYKEEDKIVQIAIPICCAYLSFFVGNATNDRANVPMVYLSI